MENPKRPDLDQLDWLANLLDNRFRIPGTNIRFGLDAIIGLVPYAGDLVGLLISLVLMFIMARRGAGPLLILKMGGNYLIDLLVGAIPLLGDIFDVFYKANRRNVDLLKAYYADGKPKPNAVTSVLFLLALLLVFWIALVWASLWGMSQAIQYLSGSL